MQDATSLPLALVTGASSGIGLELAKQFAAHDFELVVAAEDGAIHTAAAGIRAAGTPVHAVKADLSTEAGVQALHAALPRTPDAVALNAGVGAGGPFAENDLRDELQVIDLNVRGTVHLAKLLVRDMVARGQGRILFTSSIASTQPGAFHAVYNASKAFVQSFAVALREELRDTGVTVTSLMPGPTDTEFFERADMLDTKVAQGGKDDPADVAREGFEALMTGKEQVVAGSLKTKVMGRSGRFAPDGVKAKMHRQLAEPQQD